MSAAGDGSTEPHLYFCPSPARAKMQTNLQRVTSRKAASNPPQLHRNPMAATPLFLPVSRKGKNANESPAGFSHSGVCAFFDAHAFSLFRENLQAMPAPLSAPQAGGSAFGDDSLCVFYTVRHLRLPPGISCIAARRSQTSKCHSKTWASIRFACLKEKMEKIGK